MIAKDERPDLTIDDLRQRMTAHGVRQLLAKELAPNDNSKNQPYLGHSLEAVNILPVQDVRADTEAKTKALKARLRFSWLQPDGSVAPAAGAQLIVYPQYPEVRLAGFLRGARNAPSDLMNSRIGGRLLFMGITNDGGIIAWAAGPDSALVRGLEELGSLERTGVFLKVPLESGPSVTPRQALLRELRRIHDLNWIRAKALRRGGHIVDCKGTNCVGYTLEAELGVPRNGFSEPDFLGWEVKASQTNDFDHVPLNKVLTLMTPEPDGGYYVDRGVKEFIRKFGYADKLGRLDRLNFGGIFRTGERNLGTGLTFEIQGTTGRNSRSAIHLAQSRSWRTMVLSRRRGASLR